MVKSMVFVPAGPSAQRFQNRGRWNGRVQPRNPVMNITMQAITATIFSATAAVLVVNFPTPATLVEAIVPSFDEPGDAYSRDFEGQERLSELPHVDGVDTIPRLAETLDHCSHLMAKNPHVDLLPCAEAIDYARSIIAGHAAEPDLERTSTMRISDLRASYDVAQNYFCRAIWLREVEEHREFAVESCLNRDGELASLL